MKISEVIGGRRAMGEDSLGNKPYDDGDISAPGSEPTVVRIGSKLVRKHDPRLLPNVMPLSSMPITVNGRKAVLWKGMDVDGRMHVLWSYDTSAMAEDSDSYMQDPLDPEGDTDGPGKTGDQLDVGEGEVVQFKRPDIRPDAQNMQLAKSLASELFWMQVGSHYTPEEEAAERDMEDRLAKIGYKAEWDLDAPEYTMVITHVPSGRQYRMGEDELINDNIDEQEGDRIVDSQGLSRLADEISRRVPNAAATMSRLKRLGSIASRLGAPLALLAGLASSIASAAPKDQPAAIATVDMTFRQMMQAVDSARNGREADAILKKWLSVTRPPGPVPPDPPVTPEMVRKKPWLRPDGSDTMESQDVWDKPNPVKKHTKLSPADKAAARARAKRAGRKYPNMVDNIWAARR